MTDNDDNDDGNANGNDTVGSPIIRTPREFEELFIPLGVPYC